MRVCAKCGKPVKVPAWKYCNDCTYGTVLLDVDLEHIHTLTKKTQLEIEQRMEYMKKRVSLAKQEQDRLANKLEMTERAMNILVSENNQLKDEYDLLQENFYKLCQFNGGKFLRELIKLCQFKDGKFLQELICKK